MKQTYRIEIAGYDDELHVKTRIAFSLIRSAVTVWRKVGNAGRFEEIDTIAADDPEAERKVGDIADQVGCDPQVVRSIVDAFLNRNRDAEQTASAA